MQDWIFADIGFDTNLRLWMIEFYGPQRQLIRVVHTVGVSVKGGEAKQIEWHDNQGGEYYHIRERIYAENLSSMLQESSADPLGHPGKIIVTYDSAYEALYVPDGYASLRYAYDLKTGKGFVEFFDVDGILLSKFTDKWIMVENVLRSTVGEYPKIRFLVRKEDITSITVTASAVVIAGNLVSSLPKTATTGNY
jgi:hypothetical protein